MYGAILGDIIGSPFEFEKGKQDRDFMLFRGSSRFTDDTTMTIAVADALMKAEDLGQLDDEAKVKDLLIDSMKAWGRRYIHAGYGGRFRNWLLTATREPYHSFGNGSAMRVSPAGWMADDMETVRKLARWSAEVTHDHPEGIKGAESTAAAILMARKGCSKEEIKEYISSEFGYDLKRTCDDIRPGYSFDVSCQGSVPESIICFLEGTSYEDTVRNAVSLGGDTDTMGCIAGSIAEAYYGLPGELKEEGRKRLPDDMRKVADSFTKRKVMG